jgi:deoxyribodipyrimidine photolyase-related protein
MAPRLITILGDQLDRKSPALLAGNKSRDTILMMEVAHESRHVPSHRARTVLFLAAMRHHAAWLREQGWRVQYINLDDPSNTGTFSGEITRTARELQAREAITVEAGEQRRRALPHHPRRSPLPHVPRRV